MALPVWAAMRLERTILRLPYMSLSLEHAVDVRGGERLAVGGEVAGQRHLRGDGLEGHALLAQRESVVDDFRAALGNGRAAAELAGTLAGGLELGDQRGLFELGDGTENLAHHHRGRGFLDEEARCGGGDERDAEGLEVIVADQLDGEVAGEAVGALDQDHAHAIAGDVVEHLGEAGTLRYRI